MGVSTTTTSVVSMPTPSVTIGALARWRSSSAFASASFSLALSTCAWAEVILVWSSSVCLASLARSFSSALASSWRSRSTAGMRGLAEALGSGLAEGCVAQIQRQQYARLLARRCEREDTLELRIRYATALADVGQIDEAQAVTDQLVLDVPDEQEVWMLCLRLAVMRRDGDEVHRVIDAIDKQHVYLSADNREKLAFWRDGEEAR